MHLRALEQLTMDDLPEVGGKNASLGEMLTHLSGAGVKVPGGFATTAASFKAFLAQNGVGERIYGLLDSLDIEDITSLKKTGEAIRQLIMQTPLLPDVEEAVRAAYKEMGDEVSVAVRSSATAEDLPDASFAGQQETFLNVVGIDNVLLAIHEVYASLFNDRAIAYRAHQGFRHDDVAISCAIQQMVNASEGASGVMFTMDTESGFNDVVFITAAYGLGELVVQGAVNPDEFYVYKTALKNERDAILRRTLGSKKLKMVFSKDKTKKVETLDVDAESRAQFAINDQDIEILSKYALLIEAHYKKPMDIEWAKDGDSGEIFILQARPETVKSRQNLKALERYELKSHSEILCEGRSIGQRIGQGKTRVVKDIDELDKVQKGDVLVTDMTDPDWEPVMKRASAIVTNRGGRTCHAAIIARELGIPAVVGCGEADKVLKDGQDVTVSCAEGDVGYIYDGLQEFEIKRIDIDNMPELPVKVMLNVANPERAFSFQQVPNSGVGLARLEFLISNTIGVHPKALLEFDSLDDESLKQAILDKTNAYESPVEYYIERLKEGIATIAASFYPKPIIVRLSDFKSNEYAHLLGGTRYEPLEENPMLGFRGASRYAAPSFSDCFALECQAVKRVREEMGLNNVEVMIPFVRTIAEAQGVIETLAHNGLKRGENGLRVIMMCELPSNALLAEKFLNYFDGFSIGSNDLTQLTLGLDRDSGLVANSFDERDEAVKALLHLAIKACKKHNKYVGICGQGPSDHKDFAQWLMAEGIDSISLNPDSVLDTCLFLAEEMSEVSAES